MLGGRGVKRYPGPRLARDYPSYAARSWHQLANYSQHRLRVLPGQAHNLWIDDPDSFPADRAIIMVVLIAIRCRGDADV